jgi:hypothetical protein
VQINVEHLPSLIGCLKARLSALLIAVLAGVVPGQSASSMSSVNLLGQASGYLSIWLGEASQPGSATSTVIDRIQLDEMYPAKEIVLNVKTNFMHWNVSASAQSEGADNHGQSVSSLNKVDFQCTSPDASVSTFPTGNLSQLHTATAIATGSAPTVQEGTKLRIKYSLRHEQARESIIAVIQYRLESRP